MELLVILLVLAALIIACVTYVALRDRRTSGERQRFEAGPQAAPYTEEAGITDQAHRTASGGSNP